MKTNGEGKSPYQIPNLDRALTVIELLARCGTGAGLSVSEISDELKIPKNSAFRITVTLEGRGYLERSEASRKFRLTRKFLTMGTCAASDANLFEKSLDVMRRLRDATGETALIGTLIGAEGVVLDQAPGLHPFKFMVDPGNRFALHTAAPGKAILAALPESERKALIEKMPFPRFTERTITSRPRFRHHLGEVAQRGYAFDLSEEFEGQYCVGAAIIDARGYPVASLWITAPSMRLPDSRLDEIGRLVKRHADEISTRFGASIQNGIGSRFAIRDRAADLG